MLYNSIQKKESDLIYGNFGASATLTTQIRRIFFESRHLKNVPEIYSRSKPGGHKSFYVLIISPSQFPRCFICLRGSEQSSLLQPVKLFQQAWPSRQIWSLNKEAPAHVRRKALSQPQQASCTLPSSSRKPIQQPRSWRSDSVSLLKQQHSSNRIRYPPFVSTSYKPLPYHQTHRHLSFTSHEKLAL